MSRLLIIKGPNVGVSYELGERTRIGRLGENEIQVPDPNVSRIHAEITNDKDQYIISDRGSKNGVIINNQAVAEKQLEPGDEILIGGATFLFEGDIEIHNARYSNNSIFYIDQGKKALGAKEAAAYKMLKEDEAKDVTGLLAIADMFTGEVENLPQICEQTCEHIRNYFKADHTVLFMRERPEAELRPYEAAPHNEAVTVDGAFLKRVENEKQPFSLKESLASSQSIAAGGADETPVPEIDVTQKNATITPDLKTSDGETPRRPPDEPVAMMCAPLLVGDQVTGLILITRRNDAFAMEELARLKVIAAFASIKINSVMAVDAARRKNQPAMLDPDQRSASTRSLRMQEIYNSARRSADSGSAILITGEPGTGKETLGRFIHESGARASGPFIVVNCAAIPPDQFESELFGYQQHDEDESSSTVPGKVEQAIGGTLFLQEVGELELSLQPKLLRFLQDRAFYRVGSTTAVEADIQVTAATSVDLAAAVRAGRFREDLWYRLNVVPFHMPPLRERREDVGPLVDFFINYHSNRLNRKVLGANDSAVVLLQKYNWPGNIRELDNAIERAVLLAESKVLSTSDFSHIEEARRKLNSQADLERKRDTKPLAEVERQHIIIALKKHNFNQARAAEALGLHRNTLRNKIIEYGIEIPK